MAILEAAILALPVLAFDTGGNTDIIANGQNGFLFALGDSKGILSKASEWKNTKKFYKFQRQAKAYNQKHLDPSKGSEAYRDLVNSL